MSEKYSIFDSFKKGFNVFMNKDPTINTNNNFDLYSFLTAYGSGSDRPDRIQLSYGNDKTIITPILNKIAVDCTTKNIKHVIIDPLTNRFIQEVTDSGLNECLNLEANIDQTGRAFIHDLVLSMLDEGVVAVVPTHVDIKSGESFFKDNFSSFDIRSMRVGKIVKWYPNYIDVKVYNEQIMKREVVSIAKNKCAIIENPFYHVMNANQSILKRLNRKLAIIDLINEKQGSDKLEMILRLPYAVRSELKQELAKKRTEDIERQLENNKRGIVYLDNQEQLQQLSKPVENQIMSVVEYLTSMLYGQFGISKEVFEGTANELQINYYYSNTIKPILNAIVDEFKRKFLTKTARSQGHTIRYYINTFEYASINNLADSADKFTRNAIMTSNEFRDILGLAPSEQPIADELSNKNMPIDYQNLMTQQTQPYIEDDQYNNLDEADINQNE